MTFTTQCITLEEANRRIILEAGLIIPYNPISMSVIVSALNQLYFIEARERGITLASVQQEYSRAVTSNLGATLISSRPLRGSDGSVIHLMTSRTFPCTKTGQES